MRETRSGRGSSTRQHHPPLSTLCCFRPPASLRQHPRLPCPPLPNWCREGISSKSARMCAGTGWHHGRWMPFGWWEKPRGSIARYTRQHAGEPPRHGLSADSWQNPHRLLPPLGRSSPPSQTPSLFRPTDRHMEVLFPPHIGGLPGFQTGISRGGEGEEQGTWDKASTAASMDAAPRTTKGQTHAMGRWHSGNSCGASGDEGMGRSKENSSALTHLGGGEKQCSSGESVGKFGGLELAEGDTARVRSTGRGREKGTWKGRYDVGGGAWENTLGSKG